MSYGSYGGGRYVNQRYAAGISSVMPPGVKWLLIVNTALFVLYFFAYRTSYESLFTPFWLRSDWVLHGFAVWQLFTYLFLHSPVDFSHIFWNMASLWMFGRELEGKWGTRGFLKYYFVCGVGAGVLAILFNLVMGSQAATIGASGAIYGLLLAFGVLMPDVPTLFAFIVPMKAKYMVMIMGAMTFMLTFRQTGDGVSHVAHLGGMVVGYLYLKAPVARTARPGSSGKSGFDPIRSIGTWYNNWKLQRAKKKFQVYLKKHGDRDRMVH